jgi:hypothetical protein
MTYKWMALGPNGRILHLVEPWKATRPTAVKCHALCGEPQGAPVPTLIESDDISRCLWCLKKALGLGAT